MTWQEKRGLNSSLSATHLKGQFPGSPGLIRGQGPSGAQFPPSIPALTPPKCSNFTCTAPNAALKNKPLFIFSCKRFYLQKQLGPALSGAFLQQSQPLMDVLLPDLGSDCPTDTDSGSRTSVPPSGKAGGSCVGHLLTQLLFSGFQMAPFFS